MLGPSSTCVRLKSTVTSSGNTQWWLGLFFFLMGDGVVLKNWIFHGGWLKGGGSIDWKKLLGFFPGGGRGGALVQFGVGMWKIGIRGSGTNLMGVGIKFCQSDYKLIPSQLSCKKLSVNYLFICWIHLFIHWYINVWMCFVNSITCE